MIIVNIEYGINTQKPITFSATDEDNKVLTDTDFDEIIMTCRLIASKKSPVLFEKKLSTGDITYDNEAKEFIINMKNEDVVNLDYRDYGFGIWYKQGDYSDEVTGTLKITEGYKE